jgi:hypothetical protein
VTLAQVLWKPSPSRFAAAIGTATIGFFAGIRCLAVLDGHDSTVVAFKQENCDSCGLTTRAGHRLRHADVIRKTRTAFWRAKQYETANKSSAEKAQLSSKMDDSSVGQAQRDAR